MQNEIKKKKKLKVPREMRREKECYYTIYY